MEGIEVRKILRESNINLAWLSRQLSISPQGLSSRLNAKMIKPGFLMEINDIIGKDIFGISKSERQPILNIATSSFAALDDDNIPILEYVSVPAFSGCVGLTVYGKDAVPKYEPGDIIFVKPTETPIIPGCLYFIVTQTEKIIRTLYPEKEHVKLEAINPAIPVRTIPTKDIKHIYKIVGAISRINM